MQELTAAQKKRLKKKGKDKAKKAGGEDEGEDAPAEAAAPSKGKKAAGGKKVSAAVRKMQEEVEARRAAEEEAARIQEERMRAVSHQPCSEIPPCQPSDVCSTPDGRRELELLDSFGARPAVSFTSLMHQSPAHPKSLVNKHWLHLFWQLPRICSGVMASGIDRSEVLSCCLESQRKVLVLHVSAELTAVISNHHDQNCMWYDSGPTCRHWLRR